jgi:hypothetical protein
MTKKRLILVGGAVVVVLLAIAAGVFRFVGRSGSSSVERWVGDQIGSIAGAYLNPKLSFKDLDYQYPATVSLRDLRLTADDPANPGKTIDVIACGHAIVTLGEIPAVGKPIVIERIVLDQPLVSVMSVARGSGEFVGFSRMMRDDSGESTEKFSDVFRMRLVQFKDGKVVYDPRIPGTVPMALDRINTTLNIEPTAEGLYKIDTSIARVPVLTLTITGLLNLDTFETKGVDIKLSADLGQDKLDYLPPELQELLKRYDAKGRFDLALSGDMPLLDPLKGKVRASVKLDSANVATGEFKLPVDDVSISATFEDGKVKLPSFKVEALGGTIDVSGSATFNEPVDADLRIVAANLLVDRMLARPPPPDAPPVKLEFDLRLAGSMLTIVGKIPPPKDGPLAAIGMKNFRLYADDPVKPGEQVDVVAVKNLDVTLAEPVLPGKPIVIEKVVVDRPAVSLVATAPGSGKFIGIPKITRAEAKVEAPAAPSSPSTGPAKKLSDILHVKAFKVSDGRLVYDPRIPNTVAMSIDHISTTAALDADAPAGDVYASSVTVPHAPDFGLTATGRVNVDTLVADDVKLDLTAELGSEAVAYLAPQVQAELAPFEPSGSLTISATGTVPLLKPLTADGRADVKIESLRATFGDYRVPFDHVRLAAVVKDGRVTLPGRKVIGGPTVEALDGTVDLEGAVLLNSRFDANLALTVRDVMLNKLSAAQFGGDKRDLAGKLKADVTLVDAPLLHVVDVVTGTSIPTTQTSTTAPSFLPANWGSGKVEITEARLVGLEVIQGLGKIARSVFVDLFKKKDDRADRTIAPKESATVAFTFEHDHATVTDLHYEGEIVAAEGKGKIYLNRTLDLDVAGGPIAKLGGKGRLGDWLKWASDSLLYCHVAGTISDPKYEVKTGDGKPIGKLIDKGAAGVGKGLKATGDLLKKTFGGKKKTDE